MRADRLVAIVLLLQVHGRMTAAEMADRLETSERTIRRDLDALCVAGVPIYPQRGRGGGWSLLGGHRTDLSGLTAEEAQVLLLATDPASTALGPGLSEGLASVRRKLLAALPEVLRDQVTEAAGSVLIDRSRWGPADGRPPEPLPVPERSGEAAHLGALRRAVLNGRQVLVRYEPPGRPEEERRLHPHGLVSKRGVWYLVASAPTGLRTYRLSRVRRVEITSDPIEIPDGFDLAAAWSDIQRGFAGRLEEPVTVELVVETRSVRRLRATVGSWWSLEETGSVGEGRSGFRVGFPTAQVAARELLGLGEEVEVLSPGPVRQELAAIGQRLAERYRSD